MLGNCLELCAIAKNFKLFRGVLSYSRKYIQRNPGCLPTADNWSPPLLNLKDLLSKLLELENAWVTVGDVAVNGHLVPFRTRQIGTGFGDTVHPGKMVPKNICQRRSTFSKFPHTDFLHGITPLYNLKINYITLLCNCLA